MDVLIATHRHVVEGWLLVMLLNLFLPLILRRDAVRRIFWTRVGYFAFWAFWSMAVFSGLIVYLFAGHPHTPAVLAMMALSLLLPILDGYRAIRLRKIWNSGKNGLGFSTTIVALEIVSVLGVTIFAAMR